MKRTTKEHLGHFVVLLVVLLAGAAGVVFFGGDKLTQRYLIVALAAGYFLWGVTHHLKEGDLHPRIVAEYLLIAILGGLIMMSAVR